MFNYVEYLTWAAFDITSVKTGRKSATLSESAEIIAIVLLVFHLHKTGFVWNHKITICSSVVTNVFGTWEYRKTTHSDARFVHKSNHKNVP